MIDPLKSNGMAKYLMTLFIAILAFLAVRVYDKVDSMQDKYVERKQYADDRQQEDDNRNRMEAAVCEIQRDIKEILKALK